MYNCDEKKDDSGDLDDGEEEDYVEATRDDGAEESEDDNAEYEDENLVAAS